MPWSNLNLASPPSVARSYRGTPGTARLHWQADFRCSASTARETPMNMGSAADWWPSCGACRVSRICWPELQRCIDVNKRQGDTLVRSVCSLSTRIFRLFINEYRLRTSGTIGRRGRRCQAYCGRIQRPCNSVLSAGAEARHDWRTAVSTSKASFVPSASPFSKSPSDCAIRLVT